MINSWRTSRIRWSSASGLRDSFAACSCEAPLFGCACWAAASATKHIQTRKTIGTTLQILSIIPPNLFKRPVAQSNSADLFRRYELDAGTNSSHPQLKQVSGLAPGTRQQAKLRVSSRHI